MTNYIFDTMGTTVSLEITDKRMLNTDQIVEKIKSCFNNLDNIFSTYKPDSFITKLNQGSVVITDSSEVEHVMDLAENFSKQTNKYFDVKNIQGEIDPSGIVKAYAISQAGKILIKNGFNNWCLNCGGDILVHDGSNKKWSIGIMDPDSKRNLLSQVNLNKVFCSIATSGFSERGNHIWNNVDDVESNIIQATVISDDIIFSDILATTLISTGSKALDWFFGSKNFEALLVLKDRSLLATPGYQKLV